MTLVRLGMSLVGIFQAFNKAVHAILSFTPLSLISHPRIGARCSRNDVIAACEINGLLKAPHDLIPVGHGFRRDGVVEAAKE